MITIATLSGCATLSVAPPGKISVPPVWRAKISPAEAPITPSEWWKALGDPDLDRFIDQAFENNPDLAISAARIQQARAMVDIAEAERRPNVSLGAEARRERVPETRFRDSDGVSTRVSPYRRNQFATQLEASYEVDLLGRLALSSQISETEWIATESERQVVRQWVAHEVVAAYADARLTEALSPHVKEAYALASERLATEQARKTAGLISQSSVHAAEDDVAKMQEASVALERHRAIGLTRLALLLGRAPADLAWSSSDRYLVGPTFTGAVEADLPMLVLDRRPDVNAAWHRLFAATAETERARLEKYPRLTLTGSAGFLSQTLRRWLTGDALGWVIGAAASTPLFDGGRIEARVHSAHAQRAEREAEYRKSVLQALQEVEAALVEIEGARAQIEIAKRTLSRRQTDVSRSRHLVSQGVESRRIFLQAELARVEASQVMIERRHALLLAWASTQKALGR